MHALKRLLKLLLNLWVFLILIEVIWMLLPFAGFLYGSILHIHYLNQNPHTAWLTHFVFPVLTLFPLGPVMMVAGLAIFFTGAAQIYTAKIRHSGLVTTGLYSRVRHPQYIALALFGMGIIITWGRFITFIAFFLMLYLYYRLALSEEKRCEKLFGEAYESYREKTSFIVPGDEKIARIISMTPSMNLPGWILIPLQVIAVTGLAILAGHGIQYIKTRTMKVPFVSLELTNLPVRMPAEASPFITLNNGRIILLKGPYGGISQHGVMNKIKRAVVSSTSLPDQISRLGITGYDKAAILVGLPGGWTGRPHANARRLKLLVARIHPQAPGLSPEEFLGDPQKRRVVTGFTCILDLDLQGHDPIGNYEKCFHRMLIHRFQNMLSRVMERFPAVRGAAGKGPVELIFVKAPLVKTRIDEAFTREIVGRLAGSRTFLGALRMYGAGGDVVAVAFPRPGPNWYREHNRQPQVGIFVILAKRPRGVTDARLLQPYGDGTRKLLRAFVLEMDLSIPPPSDPVYTGPVGIGPGRDLEERWSFFLSGI